MADGKRPSLALEQRSERGSAAARRLRRSGLIPGILYGAGEKEAISFTVSSRDLRQALLAGSAVLDAKVGKGKERPVIVKDQQLHPVRGEVMHLDLLQVRLDEKIQSTVAVELQGIDDAPGVKEGGVLEHVTRELAIEALPTDIPESVVVDVSEMEIAGTMHLSEIDVPAGLELLDDLEETIVATITAPTDVPEEPDVEEETERVGEEGEPVEAEEAEEGAEGEEPGSDSAEES